jgi:hypothetical protein
VDTGSVDFFGSGYGGKLLQSLAAVHTWPEEVTDVLLTQESFARERTLVAVPHLPLPGVGHFRVMGRGFEWVPAAYGNRAPTVTDTFADPHKNGDKP